MLESATTALALAKRAAAKIEKRILMDLFGYGGVFVEEVKIEGVSEDDAEEQW